MVSNMPEIVKNYQLSKEVSSYADCNAERNTCLIYIYLNNVKTNNKKGKS